MSDFCNSNGLVNGRISAGSPCTFLAQCELKNTNCPTPEETKSCDYSCAVARAFSITEGR